MVGISEDLKVLAAHQLFRAAMQKDVELLNKAQQELVNVPSISARLGVERAARHR